MAGAGTPAESTRETPAAEHRRRAEARGAVGCAVITVSDSRTRETDEGGNLLCSLLEQAGHRVLARALVPDEASEIEGALREALAVTGVEAVFLTGGTGIAPRDRTVDAVRRVLDAELPGFGELFRMLSFEAIGPAAMLSRATAGRAGTAFVACLPGSPAGVRLAMERLVLPELRHVVNELQRPAARGPRGGAGR